MVVRERRPPVHKVWTKEHRSIDQDPGQLYFATIDPPQVTATRPFDAAVIAAIDDDFLAANHEALRRYTSDGRERAVVGLTGRPDALAALGEQVFVGYRTHGAAQPLAVYRRSDLAPVGIVGGVIDVRGVWPLAEGRLLVLTGDRLRIVRASN